MRRTVDSVSLRSNPESGEVPTAIVPPLVRKVVLRLQELAG
jgi:hypothetical protein